MKLDQICDFPLLVASLQEYSPKMEQGSMAKTPVETIPKELQKEEDISQRPKETTERRKPEKMIPNSVYASIQFQSDSWNRQQYKVAPKQQIEGFENWTEICTILPRWNLTNLLVF